MTDGKKKKMNTDDKTPEENKTPDAEQSAETPAEKPSLPETSLTLEESDDAPPAEPPAQPTAEDKPAPPPELNDGGLSLDMDDDETSAAPSAQAEPPSSEPPQTTPEPLQPPQQETQQAAPETPQPAPPEVPQTEPATPQPAPPEVPQTEPETPQPAPPKVPQTDPEKPQPVQPEVPQPPSEQLQTRQMPESGQNDPPHPEHTPVQEPPQEPQQETAITEPPPEQTTAPPPAQSAPQDEPQPSQLSASTEPDSAGETAAHSPTISAGENMDSMDDMGDMEDMGDMPISEMQDEPKSKKKIFMAAGGAAVLALVGGGYLFLSSGQDTPVPPRQTAAREAPLPPEDTQPTEFAAFDASDQTPPSSDDMQGAGLIEIDGLDFAAPPQPEPLSRGEEESFEFAALSGTPDTAEPQSESGFSFAPDDIPPPTWGGTEDNGMSGFPGAFDADDDISAESDAIEPQEGFFETAEVSEETPIDLQDGLPLPPVETEDSALALGFSPFDDEDERVEQGSADAEETPESVADAEDATETETDAVQVSESRDIDLPVVNAFPDFKQDDIPAPVSTSDAAPPPMATETGIDTAIAPRPIDPSLPVAGQRLEELLPPPPQEMPEETERRINEARRAMTQGELEGDAIATHRETLREVPAKEAMVRPLPKQYLIIERADKKPGMPPVARQAVSAGTPLPRTADQEKLRRAIAEQQAGNRQGAMEIYESILRENPTDLNALTNMLGLLRREHPGLALEKLAELRTIYPRHPGVAAQLAVTHADLKNFAEALHFLDIAANLDTPNAYYPFSKGVIFDRMGRRGEANAHYRNALAMLERGQIGPQHVPRDFLRKRLGISY
ncbi:MAG: hypothetical protein EA357_07210 [Micavibrio sp.]|nr:MAG: hypothetical protein EA357_07210 [Micavibrio sp.]